jgi:AraC family transcriptional regulator
MADQNDYGNRLGNAFGLKNPPTLATQTLLKGTLAVTQLRCDQPNLGMTKSIPYEDAFIATLMLNNFLVHDYWVDGRAVTTKPLAAG